MAQAMTTKVSKPLRLFDTQKIFKPSGFDDWSLPPGPLDLEIGCGVGFHPLHHALQNPDRSIIAIEHSKERFEKFQRRFENHGRPSNLFPIHAQAQAWVTHFLPEASLSKIFILYPNPYPKSQDRNKRWHAMPFMGELLKKIKPDGELILATNEGFYRQECIDFMGHTWGLKLKEDRSIQKPEKPRTHFEKKYLERGETCFNLKFNFQSAQRP